MGDGRQREREATFTNSYLESTFYNDSYIDLGCLAESPHGVDVVVEDDDTHHHPHAEQQCFFAREPASVLPGREQRERGCYFLARAWSFL